ncbi:MAG: tRNA pseudouridine(38-40) synthase TruA [Candidatus Marinimicrobia bacterium]|nr:tRNA pseudouridine(38-40) synthase TruA [Candidatus Neomarinimicrobiota bacterium]
MNNLSINNNFLFVFEVEYDGTNYAGFQVQPNTKTIQGELQKALKNIYKTKITINASGRTDAGVHARKQIFHFEPPKIIEKINLKLAINSQMNGDIRIRKVGIANTDFHSRFSAIERTYKYNILLGNDIFTKDYSWQLNYNIDIKKLKKCAKIIKGEHDFTAFCNAKSDAKHKICTIKKSNWQIKKNSLIYTITANRFLHNMVRSLVGNMIKVGIGEKTVDNFQRILDEKTRYFDIYTAPPQGLFLEYVKYKKQIKWFE